MKRVDARGLSCPEPVIRAKNAMESGDKEYEILVDNVVAKENVSRFANHQGYQVQVEEPDDQILLNIRTWSHILRHFIPIMELFSSEETAKA